MGLCLVLASVWEAATRSNQDLRWDVAAAERCVGGGGVFMTNLQMDRWGGKGSF